VNLTNIQLDALKELANIGSGNAATSLSSMIGQPVDVSVPDVRVLALADAVDAAGDPESVVHAVLLPLEGDLGAHVLLVFDAGTTATLCGLLGLDPDDELASSMLSEIGNILSSSYVGVLSAMSGLEITLCPPEGVHDMLAAIVATVLGSIASESDTTLYMESALTVEGVPCSFSFMLLPDATAVGELLTRLGLDG
jgi:chemotaxis protein CheC